MRWNRYEVVETRPNTQVTFNARSYPTRWLATWAAARRIQQNLVADSDRTFEVREKEPAVRKGEWWYELSVLQAPGWRPIPTASVMAGSTVIHLTFGLTRWHALGRASKWANPRSRQQVRVSRWGNARTFVPEEPDQKSEPPGTGVAGGN